MININKITEGCKGCFNQQTLSMHGGDMRPTFVCNNSRTCLNLNQYYNPSEIEPQEKTLEELKKELVEVVKTVKKIIKSLDVLKSL